MTIEPPAAKKETLEEIAERIASQLGNVTARTATTTEANTTDPAVQPFKLDLPQEPIDGFEVAYFDVDGDYLSHIKLKYHVNSRWTDVVDEDSCFADFINQWQVFDRDRFVGRIDGWATPLKTPHANSYHCREDALRALIQRFTNKAIGYEKMAADYHERAQRLTGELP